VGSLAIDLSKPLLDACKMWPCSISGRNLADREKAATRASLQLERVRAQQQDLLMPFMANVTIYDHSKAYMERELELTNNHMATWLDLADHVSVRTFKIDVQRYQSTVQQKRVFLEVFAGRNGKFASRRKQMPTLHRDMAGRAGAGVAENSSILSNANAPCVPERRADRAPDATDVFQADEDDTW
jgi:hypothetical protein